MAFAYRKISEILNLQPLICDPDMNVYEASKLMADKGVGSLLVVEDTLPTGIITERDIVTKTIAKGLDPKKTKLSSIMTSPVITILPNADIISAAKLMSKKRIRRLPVVGENILMGIITDRDILRISPDLMTTSEDLKDFFCYDTPSAVEDAGYCEMCRSYSNNLMDVDGKLMCDDCRDRD